MRNLIPLTSALVWTLTTLAAHAQPTPKYSAKIPPYITTPDRVETRIGTLKFFDGQPDPETVRKVYDNLNFVRGVEAFLSGIPAASVYAACEGLSGEGVKRNTHIGIMEDLMDARSVFLTGPKSYTNYSSYQVQPFTDPPALLGLPGTGTHPATVIPLPGRAGRLAVHRGSESCGPERYP